MCGNSAYPALFEVSFRRVESVTFRSCQVFVLRQFLFPRI